MVSVIVPVHNAVESLAESIASIQNQTYAGWEAIIVDDGSTDESLAVSLDFARTDGRFRVVSQDRLGASAARNTGINHATADWLLFLDADDWISPLHLERMTGALKSRPELDGIVCQWKRAHPDGMAVNPDRCWIDLDRFFPESVLGCPFAIHACVVRKRTVEAVSGFNTALANCSDWHLWQKISRTGAKFAGIDACLAFYRMLPHSISRNTGRPFKDAITVIEIGLNPDPAVARPLPQFVMGADAECGNQAKSLALAYWGGMTIWQGGEANILLDDIGSPFKLQILPGQLVEVLLIGIAYAACRLDTGWMDQWARIETPILNFIDAVAPLSDNPRFALQSKKQIHPALRRRGILTE